MTEASEEFLGFGGHKASGGFEIKEEKIHFLEEKLTEALENTKLAEKEKIIIDAEIGLDDVTLENYHEIEKLEPYGMANQKPHFFFRGVEVFSVNFFGKEKSHLELIFKNSRNFSIKAIAFSFHDLLGDINFSAGDRINLVASFELNR